MFKLVEPIIRVHSWKHQNIWRIENEFPAVNVLPHTHKKNLFKNVQHWKVFIMRHVWNCIFTHTWIRPRLVSLYQHPCIDFKLVCPTAARRHMFRAHAVSSLSPIAYYKQLCAKAINGTHVPHWQTLPYGDKAVSITRQTANRFVS